MEDASSRSQRAWGEGLAFLGVIESIAFCKFWPALADAVQCGRVFGDFGDFGISGLSGRELAIFRFWVGSFRKYRTEWRVFEGQGGKETGMRGPGPSSASRGDAAVLDEAQRRGDMEDAEVSDRRGVS